MYGMLLESVQHFVQVSLDNQIFVRDSSRFMFHNLNHEIDANVNTKHMIDFLIDSEKMQPIVFFSR